MADTSAKVDASSSSKSATKSAPTEKLVTLISRLDHDVTVVIGDDSIMIPPRGKAKNIIFSKINSDLPTGVMVKDQGDK